MSELYPHAKTAQMPRNGIISLLQSPELGIIIHGAYVRVLLELPERNEDYLLARVIGVEHGEAYNGFSQQAGTLTTILLKLQLPTSLTSINGALYQLNSISNSPMTQEEFDRWVHESNNEFALPTVSELAEISERIRPFAARRAAPGAAPQPPHQQQQQQQPPSAAPVPAARPPAGQVVARSHNLNATVKDDSNAVAKRTAQSNASPRSSDVGGDNSDLPTYAQLHHHVLNEMRDTSALFPKNLGDLKVSQLLVTERDLMEYLDNIREAITQKRSFCIACMHNVASVIMLPCKHKNLCRNCAFQVSTCPMCREVVLEMFEAVEN